MICLHPSFETQAWISPQYDDTGFGNITGHVVVFRVSCITCGTPLLWQETVPQVSDDGYMVQMWATAAPKEVANG